MKDELGIMKEEVGSGACFPPHHHTSYALFLASQEDE